MYLHEVSFFVTDKQVSCIKNLLELRLTETIENFVVLGYNLQFIFSSIRQDILMVLFNLWFDFQHD